MVYVHMRYMVLRKWGRACIYAAMLHGEVNLLLHLTFLFELEPKTENHNCDNNKNPRPGFSEREADQLENSYSN